MPDAMATATSGAATMVSWRRHSGIVISAALSVLMVAGLALAADLAPAPAVGLAGIVSAVVALAFLRSPSPGSALPIP